MAKIRGAVPSKIMRNYPAIEPCMARAVAKAQYTAGNAMRIFKWLIDWLIGWTRIFDTFFPAAFQIPPPTASTLAPRNNVITLSPWNTVSCSTTIPSTKLAFLNRRRASCSRAGATPVSVPTPRNPSPRRTARRTATTGAPPSTAPVSASSATTAPATSPRRGCRSGVNPASSPHSAASHRQSPAPSQVSVFPDPLPSPRHPSQRPRRRRRCTTYPRLTTLHRSHHVPEVCGRAGSRRRRQTVTDTAPRAIPRFPRRRLSRFCEGRSRRRRWRFCYSRATTRAPPPRRRRRISCSSTSLAWPCWIRTFLHSAKAGTFLLHPPPRRWPTVSPGRPFFCPITPQRPLRRCRIFRRISKWKMGLVRRRRTAACPVGRRVRGCSGSTWPRRVSTRTMRRAERWCESGGLPRRRVTAVDRLSRREPRVLIVWGAVTRPCHIRWRSGTGRCTTSVMSARRRSSSCPIWPLIFGTSKRASYHSSIAKNQQINEKSTRINFYHTKLIQNLFRFVIQLFFNLLSLLSNFWKVLESVYLSFQDAYGRTAVFLFNGNDTLRRFFPRFFLVFLFRAFPSHVLSRINRRFSNKTSFLQCGKGFIQFAHLTKHHLVHTGRVVAEILPGCNLGHCVDQY